jgi:RNA polymerase sigma-B factor
VIPAARWPVRPGERGFVMAGASSDRSSTARAHASRDAGAREELVRRYLPLSRRLASRYVGNSEREDLEQVAALGLLKAVDRYDPERGIAFSSFAVPTILGEL